MKVLLARFTRHFLVYQITHFYSMLKFLTDLALAVLEVLASDYNKIELHDLFTEFEQLELLEQGTIIEFIE